MRLAPSLPLLLFTCAFPSQALAGPNAIQPLEALFGPPVSQESPTSLEDLAAPERRVLIFPDGRALRGFCRLADGAWEVRSKGKWVRLAFAPALSYRLESELLREARKLAKETTRDDLGVRTKHADWLIRAGLWQEAEEELNGILNLDPDNAGALALIRPPAFVAPRTRGWLEDPANAQQTLMIAGQSADAVQRELLIESLGALRATFGEQLEASAKPASGSRTPTVSAAKLSAPPSNPGEGHQIPCPLRPGLVAALHDPQIAQRTFAAHALRRLFPGEELMPLLERCVLDVSGPVRKEAALAVRIAQEPRLVLPLVKALGSESRAIRTNATESLGIIGYTSAVPVLVNHYANLASSGGVMPITSHIRIGSELLYIQDFDVEIAQGASIADPILKSAHDVVQLEARVGGVSGYTLMTEKRTIYQSLKQLTGEDPGPSPKAWEAWLEQRAELYR